MRHCWAILFTLLLGVASAAEADAPDFGIPTTGAFVPALSSFDDTIVSYMKRRAIPGGAFALVENGKLLYARGYGFADREAKTPIQPTSLFRLASLSKPITAVAIMTLFESRKFDLDAKVVSLLKLKPFLKEGQTEDPRIHDVTVRHLLQHSGGWNRDVSGDTMFKHFQIADEMHTTSPPDRSDVVRWGLGQKLDFAPGTKYAYSNFGYCVLGRLIECVSGKTYEDYVRSHVLAPMGIHDMRIGQARRSERFEGEVRYYIENDATGPNVMSGDGIDRVSIPYGFASPQTMDAHGGWIASAVDLARFATALDLPNEKPVLRAETQALMYARPTPPLGLNASGASSTVFYGLGWNVRPQGNAGKANVWHTGAMPGTSTMLVRLANGRSWVVLFNQRADGKADDNIDALLHAAAMKVKVWPTTDLFDSYK